MRNRHLCRLVPLTAAATLLMAGTVSAEPAVEIGQIADLVASGAQVDVPLSVTCDPGGPDGPGGTRSLSVQVRQAAGDVVASGGAYSDNLICDGAPHETTVPVLADPGSRPFHAGDAAVQATVTLCVFGPGLVAGEEPSLRQVTPPGDPSPEPPGPSPAPSPEPPSPAPELPLAPGLPAPVPPPGDIVAPCQTAVASGVVFVHPNVSGEHPELP